MLTRALRRNARFRHADDGVTLAETVVALSIAVVVFLALTMAVLGAIRASVLSRQNQQSGDVLNQALEAARATGYDGLAMRSSDLSVNESLNLNSGYYNPTNDTSTGSAKEPLVLDAAGAVSPHVTTVTQN